MEKQSTSPYSDLDPNAFWRTGVGKYSAESPPSLYKKKFSIDRRMAIAAAGSCFAQHISRNLRARGFNVLNAEPAPSWLTPEEATDYGYGIYSARYGNIYTIRQLLQLAKEAWGEFSPQDFIWEKDGRYYDALRPAIEVNGYASPEELLASRAHHLKAVSRMVRHADLLVFTFGLTEAWIHEPSGTVYATAPATIAGKYDPAIHKFKNFTFQEIYADFLELRQTLRRINPDIKFLVTVSPVPLTATASGDHVLSATIYSKSVLRSVTGQLSAEFPDVDYFPSYELIASHFSRGKFYEDNLRNVSATGVDAAMSMFLAEHDSGPRVALAPAPVAHSEVSISEDDDVVCEEMLLEAFNPSR